MRVEAEFELHFFLMSFLYGMVFLFLYDGIRAFRLVFRPWIGFRFFTDALFGSLGGLIGFFIVYLENSGILRMYALLGLIAGMFVYNRLISRKYVYYLSRTLSFFWQKVQRLFAWIGKKEKRLAKRLGDQRKEILEGQKKRKEKQLQKKQRKE